MRLTTTDPTTPTVTRHARAIHYVGSLPPELSRTDQDAMQWVLDHSGGVPLTTLPSDRDPRWVVGWLLNLRTLESLEAIADGDCSDYDAMPAYRLRRGAHLTPADIALGRPTEVAVAMAARRGLDTPVPLPPQQVSIPSPVDLALFCFGIPLAARRQLSARHSAAAIRAALRHLPTFVTAIAQEITQIHKRWGDEVAFQIESPAVLIGYDRTPRALWPLVTRQLVRATAALLTAIPDTARTVLHTSCRGDLGHRPISHLTDLRAMTAFHNALADHLHRHERDCPPVHLVLCDGENPPSVQTDTYLPLLNLDPNIEVIAGVVDENHPAASATALRLTENMLRRPALAVAAACGHGRRTPAATTRNAALAVVLATAPTTRLPSERPNRLVRA